MAIKTESIVTPPKKWTKSEVEMSVEPGTVLRDDVGNVFLTIVSPGGKTAIAYVGKNFLDTDNNDSIGPFHRASPDATITITQRRP